MKSRWIGLIFVVIFSALFAIRQYQPGTILMGWDSLHPEFNYQLAFSRVSSGAWRESQGFGAVAVHSHMSELPRIAILWVIDLLVPTSVVRWTYILLMLALGVEGTYVLLVHILSRIRGGLGIGWVTTVAIVGSLAYLFNLSTLHHFLIPFEMFVVLFGLLPWSLWSVSRYLQVPTRQRMAFFLLIQFLISSCAFAATLWVVYFGVLAMTTWFLTKNKKLWVKVLVLTLMVNSYWLMPTIYGLVTTGGVVASAKINQVFSPEAWLNNVAYGATQQVMRLESFILQWMSFDRVNDKFDLVVSQWATGVNLDYVLWTLNIVAGMVGVGLLRWFYLLIGERDKENRRWNGLVIAGFLLFLVMLTQIWPLSMAIGWARENLPLVGEILRTPFTKVSIFLQLIYAVLISMGLLWVVEKVRFGLVRVMIIIAAVTVIVFPFTSWILKGNLMGNVVVTKNPEEYAKFFEATKKMGEGRMLAMPMSSMWGWEYRDWGNGVGYEGANFTQFGIVHPLLIRDFDRWSPYNETFYNEFSTAMYGGVDEDVATILQKYDVRYVLLDESVIAPGQGEEILRISETKKMAEELGWKEVFHEGFLTVWDTGISAGVEFVSAPRQYVLAEGDTLKSRADVIYEEVGNYVSGAGGVKYPFASLLREEIANLTFQDDTVIIRGGGEGGILAVPGWTVGEEVELTYKVNLENGNLSIDWKPMYTINGQVGPAMASLNQDFEGKYVWIQIGSNGAVFVEEGTEADGTTKLAVGEPFEIKIYDGVVEREERPTGWTREWVQKCGTNGELECYAMRLSAPTQDSLLQTISLYTGRGLEVCLDLEGEPYHCVNEIKQGKNPIVVTQAVEKGERYWLDFIVKDKGVELQEPQVRWYPLEERLTMNESVWTKFFEEQRFEIVDKELVVEIPGIPRIYDWAELGRTTTENCDVLKRGVAEKTGNSYTANERGAVCDYLELSGIGANLPYLMRMRGENVEGRSVKLFLYNQGSGRNDIEYLLNKNTFDQTFAVLPWEWDGRYTLNTETRSFGQYTENSLLPVELRYFPLEQIARARMGEGEEVGNQLRINEVKKTGTWLYQVEVEEQGLLKLSQGFDEGWIAWSREGKPFDFARGLRHVKVNGWANGWILRQAQDKFDNDAQIVVIMYWPQLLEYLGFAMLAGAAIWIARMREKVRE